MMSQLKICFIGVGSIACRHMNNLETICKERRIDLTIDAYRHKAGKDISQTVNKVYYEGEDVPDDYDVIFITNPTEYHFQALTLFHDKGKHFFIEKPAVSLQQIRSAEQFGLRDDSVYYVACPLRYNAVIDYIKNNMDPDDILSVRSISSSYLPDWRPGQDYRQTYSAHRDLGGGVGIDLIHEWDYLTYLFGWPEKIFHMSGKKSSLEIDSDDYAIYIAEYRNKTAELHLDYFGRNTIREIELITSKETVIGDLYRNRIRFLGSDQCIDFQEERNDYQKRELNHFLDLINGDAEDENGFIHGLKVLKLTQGIC